MGLNTYHKGNIILNEYDILRRDLETYTDYLLANYCMPTLLKMKPACLFRLSKKNTWKTENFLTKLEETLNSFHSKYKILYENSLMLVVLTYNNELLKEVVTNKEGHNFLQAMGYSWHGLDMDDILNTLKQRYWTYIENSKSITFNSVNGLTNLQETNSCNNEFPHEIGIILGYPVMDVKDFMRYNGKNYLLCGYWKVYHDVNSARYIFAKYNEVREKALKCILEGKKLQDYYLNGGNYD